MDLFPSFLKSTTEQVNSLGKCATDMINSIATCTPLSDAQIAPPPVSGDNETMDKKECSSTSSSDEAADKDAAGDNGDLSKAILASVKSFGSVVTKSTIVFSSNVLKKGKEMVTLLENSAQENTAKQVDSPDDEVVPFWAGLDVNEKEVKEKMLALSSDRRNFLRPPPIDFAFNLEASAPMAKACLKDDESLQKMRYLLVPKEINEESFWRNYFYRISLIKLEASMEDNSEFASNDADVLSTGSVKLVTTDSSSTTKTQTLEESELVNDLADLELESIEAVDEDEINLELSDFQLSFN